MMNQYALRSIFALATCMTIALTTNAAYQSIQERQSEARAKYKALIAKWNPALNNPSDAALKTVIKKKSAALKDDYANTPDEAGLKQIKTLLEDLKAWPIQFMCNELDADIKAIFELQETARILNIDDTFDALPFQQLRKAIDTLPSMIEEREAHAQMGSLYKYYLAFFGGVLIANHYSLWPFNTSSN